MRNLIILILIFGIFFSCKENTKPNKTSDFLTKEQKIEMEYYNPNFLLDSTSNLRTDGYYEIKEIFGTYTTDGTNFKTNKPKYGFLQFFEDGFCRVASWNGIYQNPTDVKKGFISGKGYIFYGLYQIESDTLQIEYLYNPASPGAGQSEHRSTLKGIIEPNRIVIKEDTNRIFSAPNSCVGTFIEMEIYNTNLKNYLKENIEKYLEQTK